MWLLCFDCVFGVVVFWWFVCWVNGFGFIICMCLVVCFGRCFDVDVLFKCCLVIFRFW